MEDKKSFCWVGYSGFVINANCSANRTTSDKGCLYYEECSLLAEEGYSLSCKYRGCAENDDVCTNGKAICQACLELASELFDKYGLKKEPK